MAIPGDSRRWGMTSFSMPSASANSEPSEKRSRATTNAQKKRSAP